VRSSRIEVQVTRADHTQEREGDEPDEAPETPPDEPAPAPIQDPPAEPNPAPYVVRGAAGPQVRDNHE
jgi:hypothetical protein